jgi:hypothetical protein
MTSFAVFNLQQYSHCLRAAEGYSDGDKKVIETEFLDDVAAREASSQQ